jgi:hypothetical protein
MGLLIGAAYVVVTGHLPSLSLVLAYLLGALVIAFHYETTKNKDGGK